MDKILDTVMVTGSTKLYIKLVDQLEHDCNVSSSVSSTLWNFTAPIFRTELENKYSTPTSWIGLYIAVASLLCTFAMAADLFYGLKSRKLWFPCKYVTINAAAISIMTTAMKLPMDISTSMPGEVDQVTKLGSMAFLCTMMANALPSLATMNSKGLLINISGLGVMVLTLVVNVSIQIQTGVVSYNEYDQFRHDILFPIYFARPKDISNKRRNIIIAAIYLTLLLVLLMVHICSSLAILKSKKMIDGKYQELHDEAVSREPQLERLTVEKLRQHVSKCWILAGNPQFITICFVTTSASGVICVLSAALHIQTLVWTIDSVKDGDYKSDYQWSMLVIFIIQFIGVILGTIAPLCRCFVALCYKVSIESIKNHIKVLKVESYWIQKLCDWKQRSIPLMPFRSHKRKVITEHVKIFFLKFCIAFQVVVVVTCKIISLVPLFMICAFYCLKCVKDTSVTLGNRNEDPDDLHRYVLQLQDETEISETTLKWLSGSTKRLIKKGEKKQPKNLLERIKKYIEGIENFDLEHVTSLSKEYHDCWSLPVVTLTTIAVSLPGIDKSEANKLLVSVREGLLYVTHVEKCLNTTDDYVSIQMAARTLWDEFEVHETWFSNNMQEIASKKNTTREMVQLFKEKGEEDMVKEVGLNNGSQDDSSKYKSICANSMSRITDTILFCHDIDHLNQQQLFDHISQMISGILVACLTKLPKVIVMKCHTSEIEKKEATVQEAAELLGETTQIINTLQYREPQCLSPNDDVPCIEKWCACLRHAYP